MNQRQKKMFSRNRCYVVAEISANHNHCFERAEALVKAAANSGADAVKLQTYTADTLTISCQNEYFRIRGTLWEGKTLYDLYQEAYTPWEWHEPMQKLALELGMDFFSTPFDATAVDLLERLNVPIHKIASFELVDGQLLQKIAGTHKPVIVSTGMASLVEIAEAMEILRGHGAGAITLLKCTSSYPAPVSEINLRTMPVLSEVFQCPVGLSDHTLGSAVAVAAVALGAEVIEKHFTLSRKDVGPDSSFSMEPDEFKQMVSDIRAVEEAMGQIRFDSTIHEDESHVFRRSLFVVEDMKAGECFTEKNLRSIRPGYGLHPRNYHMIIGRKASRDILRGTPLDRELLV